MNALFSMIGVDHITRSLFAKEWRQLLRSRTVIITAAILPTFFLLCLPLLMMLASANGDANKPMSESFGMFAEVGADPTRLPVVILPIQVAITAIIMPLMMMTHAIISEREQRTLELLIALPVRIEHVIKSKLLATLALCGGITVPLLTIDLVVFATRGLVRPLDWFALPFLLVSVLAFSCAASVLVGLIARDFRTANNVAGLLITPPLLLNMALILLLSTRIGPLVSASLHLLGAIILTMVILRQVTFERLVR